MNHGSLMKTKALRAPAWCETAPSSVHAPRAHVCSAAEHRRRRPTPPSCGRQVRGLCAASTEQAAQGCAPGSARRNRTGSTCRSCLSRAREDHAWSHRSSASTYAYAPVPGRSNCLTLSRPSAYGHAIAHKLSTSTPSLSPSVLVASSASHYPPSASNALTCNSKGASPASLLLY